jgi:hypothetical protein
MMLDRNFPMAFLGAEEMMMALEQVCMVTAHIKFLAHGT